jgi:hypothetical protein
VTVSGQITVYQNDNCVDPVGTVNVCAIEESVEGDVEPTRAA